MTCKDQGIDIYRVHIAADIYNLSLRFIINDLASFSRISSSRLSFLLFSQFSLQKQIEFFSLFLSNICAADLPWKKSFFPRKGRKTKITIYPSDLFSCTQNKQDFLREKLRKIVFRRKNEQIDEKLVQKTDPLMKFASASLPPKTCKLETDF